MIHDQAIVAKYKGNAINDMTAYLECRRRISIGLFPAHYESLKRYYRRVFLNAPFRHRARKGA